MHRNPFNWWIPGVPTPPSLKRPCCVCLWKVGLGYDRIARQVRWNKDSVGNIIAKAKNSGKISRIFLVPPVRPKAPPKPKSDPIAKALQKVASKEKKRRIVRLRRYVWRWVFRGYRSPIAESMVGCDLVTFRSIVQSKFTNGMAWNNYASTWELDHITPCSKFDLTDPDQVRQCFHYSNYQPLPKLANRTKFTSIKPHQPELILRLSPTEDSQK